MAKRRTADGVRDMIRRAVSLDMAKCSASAVRSLCQSVRSASHGLRATPSGPHVAVVLEEWPLALLKVPSVEQILILFSPQSVSFVTGVEHPSPRLRWATGRDPSPIQETERSETRRRNLSLYWPKELGFSCI